MDTLTITHPLTADDLPEVNWPRHELLDGALIINAVPLGRHALVIESLRDQLRAVAPADMAVVENVGMVRRDREESYFVPDISVLPRELLARPESRVYDPEDFVLAVEVVSESTRTMDLVVKREKYLAWGVQRYWTVEQDDPVVVVHGGRNEPPWLAGIRRA